MGHRLSSFLSLWLFILPFPGRALGDPPALASLAGEVLEFRVRWNFITAGTASLEVVPQKGGLRLRAVAKTLPLLAKIYPFEELVESTVSLPVPRVMRYFRRAREGWRQPTEDEVIFSPPIGRAKSFRNGVPVREIDVPPEVQDPLSCFYWYRTTPADGDTPLSFAVTEGGKTVIGTVTVVGRETIETPAGTFQTVIVEPKMEGIGGIFRKSPGARVLLWLTDDRWRRPVKLQSKVVIGHFTAELVGYRHSTL